MTVGPVEKYFTYLERNPNSTKYSVVWCTNSWDVDTPNASISLPCKFESDEEQMIMYTIWYNSSQMGSNLFRPRGEPEIKNPELVFLQESIDNAILSHLYVNAE
jgi:hypothetical protein